MCRRNGYSTRDRPPKCVCLDFSIANCFSLVLHDSFKIQGPWEATLRQRFIRECSWDPSLWKGRKQDWEAEEWALVQLG